MTTVKLRINPKYRTPFSAMVPAVAYEYRIRATGVDGTISLVCGYCGRHSVNEDSGYGGDEETPLEECQADYRDSISSAFPCPYCKVKNTNGSIRDYLMEHPQEGQEIVSDL